MAASFPSSVKTFSTLADLADSVLAAHQNERGDEITAIETALIDVINEVSRINTVIDGLKLTWNGVASIDVGVGACFAENGDFIDVASAITKSSLSLSNSTWYHVYVYLDTGTPAAEVVTTAPVAWKGTAYSKTGDTSRRYVGSIKTDGSGNVIPFIHNVQNGLMAYYGVAISTTFRVLSNGQATTATSVDCSSAVPVTSRFAVAKIYDTDTSNACYLGPSSGLTTTLFHFSTYSTDVVLTEITLPLSSSQAFYYIYNSSPTGGLTVDIGGYYFER